MNFAVTTGRRRPVESDVLKGHADLHGRLESLMSARSVTLWEAMREDLEDIEEGEPEWSFTPRARVFDPGSSGRERLTKHLGNAALAAARDLYMTGDCWSFAAVAADMLDRPIALFVSDPHRATGEPDHVAVDLGEGRYLDIRGILDAEAIAVGLNAGARPEPETVDVAGLKSVFARHYESDGYSIDDSLACNGWGESTKALIEMFLEGPARAALEDGPGMRP